MKHVLGTTLLLASATLVSAQSQSMRATIRGGGGDVQKCTVEVDVDVAADVEIRGDRGFLRTVGGGQAAQWRRFECTAPIPSNAIDFRFKGIDGRGNVQLVRDPNSSGGTAVVHIEDRQGGREGYTFDLEWRGGSGAYGNNPYGRNNGTYDRNRPNDSYGRNDGRIYRNERNYPNSNNNGYGNSNADDAVRMCQDAVRARVSREYGIRNPNFRSTNLNDNPGNRDRVLGSFEGNRGEQYNYSCTLNSDNGRIRNVDIRRR